MWHHAWPCADRPQPPALERHRRSRRLAGPAAVDRGRGRAAALGLSRLGRPPTRPAGRAPVGEPGWARGRACSGPGTPRPPGRWGP